MEFIEFTLFIASFNQTKTQSTLVEESLARYSGSLSLLEEHIVR